MVKVSEEMFEKMFKKELDSADLKIMLIEFLKNTGLGFSFVENPMCHRLLQHLKPDISLPTEQELIDSANHRASIRNKIREITPGMNELMKLLSYYEDSLKKRGNESPMLSESTVSTAATQQHRGHNIRGTPEMVRADGSSISLCIVCNELMDNSKLRVLSRNDVIIILFVCVKENIHSLENAKKITQLPQYDCCTEHLENIVNHILHWFDIKNLVKDFNVSTNPIIQEEYETYNAITEGNTRRSLTSFSNGLKTFVEKYSHPTTTRRPLDPISRHLSNKS